MTDRAPAVAEFLLQPEIRGIKVEALAPLLAKHWPGLSKEELRRAIDIGCELLEAEAHEYFAEADALDELAAKRREQP